MILQMQQTQCKYEVESDKSIEKKNDSLEIFPVTAERSRASVLESLE